MSQLTIEERLEKEKRSMDKFLHEKDVEDLIIEINHTVKKPFLKTWLK